MASRLSFTVTIPPVSGDTLGPRLSLLSLSRDASSASAIQFATPGLITTTSRGIVPHLTRAAVKSSLAIKWAHIPFESFIDFNPPIPTLPEAGGLHSFLGYEPSRQVISMSLRDPADMRVMPANGKDQVCAMCMQGVRRVTPPTWRNYMLACKPDIVTALSDVPYTQPPHSQKRLTKSIERSAKWLSDLIQPNPSTSSTKETEPPLSVFVSMAGGTSAAARAAFSESLLEKFYGLDAARLAPFPNLDAGVSGYVFDLAPIRHALLATRRDDIAPPTTSQITRELVQLVRASLENLPTSKPRIAHTTTSPHEMLQLIAGAGVDAFDAHWVQQAASIGIALDFRFPVSSTGLRGTESMVKARIRLKKRKDLGHNLYDPQYSHDFSPFAASFRPASSSLDVGDPICPCAACSPKPEPKHLTHSAIDEPTPKVDPNHFAPPYTRAYIHHLLHTHEMSAPALLTAHNLAVLDDFFAGIRSVLESGGEEVFRDAIEAFEAVYDDGEELMKEAKVMWADVEVARGKGRIAREREREKEIPNEVLDTGVGGPGVVPNVDLE